MTSGKDGNKKFIKGAFLGALAGTALGVLFAPKSGKETRDAVKEKANEYAKKGEKLIKKAANETTKVIDKGQDAIENVVQSAKEKSEVAVDKIKKKVNK